MLAHFKCEGALEINGGLAATSLRAVAPVIQREMTKKAPVWVPFLSFGADYGARTRHLDLGKVALYQMS